MTHCTIVTALFLPVLVMFSHAAPPPPPAELTRFIQEDFPTVSFGGNFRTVGQFRDMFPGEHITERRSGSNDQAPSSGSSNEAPSNRLLTFLQSADTSPYYSQQEQLQDNQEKAVELMDDTPISPMWTKADFGQFFRESPQVSPSRKRRSLKRLVQMRGDGLSGGRVGISRVSISDMEWECMRRATDDIMQRSGACEVPLKKGYTDAGRIRFAFSEVPDGATLYLLEPTKSCRLTNVTSHVSRADWLLNKPRDNVFGAWFLLVGLNSGEGCTKSLF